MEAESLPSENVNLALDSKDRAGFTHTMETHQRFHLMRSCSSAACRCPASQVRLVDFAAAVAVRASAGSHAAPRA